jgi:hypothetical protein
MGLCSVTHPPLLPLSVPAVIGSTALARGAVDTPDVVIVSYASDAWPGSAKGVHYTEPKVLTECACWENQTRATHSLHRIYLYAGLETVEC